jgi:hypothetical protein
MAQKGLFADDDDDDDDDEEEEEEIKLHENRTCYSKYNYKFM